MREPKQKRTCIYCGYEIKSGEMCGNCKGKYDDVKYLLSLVKHNTLKEEVKRLRKTVARQAAEIKRLKEGAQE